MFNVWAYNQIHIFLGGPHALSPRDGQVTHSKPSGRQRNARWPTGAVSVPLFVGNGLAIVGNIYIHYIYIWVNYNDLTATSLGIMVNKGNHPQMALIQVSEVL